MRQGMVGLLAAAGTAMSGLFGCLRHGDLSWLVLLDSSAAMGLSAYLAVASANPPAFSIKKILST
jgi:hypothetical protein